MAPWVPAAIMGGSALAGSAMGALSSKGGSQDVDYEWSDEQKQGYQLAYPFMKNIMGSGLQNSGQPNMGVPQIGGAPSVYDVPSGDGLMPTKGWYDSISPEIKQGLWEPWNDAANQLQSNMGVRGQLGTPGSGYSGAAGTGLGKLYADAGQQVGMQAWNMMQPGQQAMWQANLGRNVAEYQTSLMPWQQNYQSEMEAWRMPFSMAPGLMTGSYPTGLVTQSGNPYAGGLSGAMMGGLTAYNMFGGGQNAPRNAMPGGFSPYTSGMANPGAMVDQWQYSG